jgi:hypothetical protein
MVVCWRDRLEANTRPQGPPSVEDRKRMLYERSGWRLEKERHQPLRSNIHDLARAALGPAGHSMVGAPIRTSITARPNVSEAPTTTHHGINGDPCVVGASLRAGLLVDGTSLWSRHQSLRSHMLTPEVIEVPSERKPPSRPGFLSTNDDRPRGRALAYVHPREASRAGMDVTTLALIIGRRARVRFARR